MKVVQNLVFNYLLKEEGSFYNLDAINFNHFLGEAVNPELYLDIIGLTGNVKDPRLSLFKSANNIQYFGELLERYEERGIVKSDEDFRALVLATLVNMRNFKLKPNQVNTDQFESFIKKVEDFAESKRDMFSLAILALVAKLASEKVFKFCKPDMINIEKIYKLSLEILKTNEKLSFEDRIFSIYSLWSCLEEKINFAKEQLSCFEGNLKENEKTCDSLKSDKDKLGKTFDKSEKSEKENCLKIINKLEEEIKQLEIKIGELLNLVKTIYVKPLRFKRDYYIYLMLIDMIESNESLTKSKEFNNKEIFNQFKKLLTLAKKECNKDSAYDLIKLFDMDMDDILFYNYICAKNYESALCRVSKVTSKGVLRLAQSLINYLQRDEECDEFILECIQLELNTISQTTLPGKSNRWDKSVKGMNLSLVEFFKDFKGKISLSNIEFIHNKINKHSLNKNNNVYALGNFDYMVSEGYIEYLNKLEHSDIQNALEVYMLNSNNFEYCQKSYKLWEKDFILSRCHELYKYDKNLQSIYRELYTKGILDENSDDRFICMERYVGFLESINQKQDFKKLYKEANLFVEDIAQLEMKISGFVGKDSKVYKYLVKITDIVFSVNILEYFNENDDVEFIRDFYTLQDNLKAIIASKDVYTRYLFDRLTDDEYLRIMGISEDEAHDVLKQLANKIKFLDFRFEEVLRNINELVLTDLEKNEIQEARRKEEEMKSLKKLETAKFYYDFISCINKHNDSEDFMENVKTIYMDKIRADRESLFFTHSSCEQYFTSSEHILSIAKALHRNGVTLSDDELLEISKACLETN